LIEKNLAIYSTTDMKVGLDVRRLVDAEALLADLLRLDPRGGHFAQRQLAAARQSWQSARREPAPQQLP
jgi:hypothetical protein